MEKIPLTEAGYLRLEQELKQLKSEERPEIIRAIAEAREHGDLSENAEYHAARERQSFVEGRILELEDVLSRADIIKTSDVVSVDTVRFGASVTLENEETGVKAVYQLVGAPEADFSTKRIAINSPMGRAMIGKNVGNVVEFTTPNGVKTYEILAIEYK